MTYTVVSLSYDLFQLVDYNKGMTKSKKSDSVFDDVFKRSLSEFHLDMQATLSVEKQVSICCCH